MGNDTCHPACINVLDALDIFIVTHLYDEIGAVAFVERRGRAPFGTMEVSLCGETLGRCFGFS